jgi:hypothetical protein
MPIDYHESTHFFFSKQIIPESLVIKLVSLAFSTQPCSPQSHEKPTSYQIKTFHNLILLLIILINEAKDTQGHVDFNNRSRAKHCVCSKACQLTIKCRTAKPTLAKHLNTFAMHNNTCDVNRIRI